MPPRRSSKATATDVSDPDLEWALRESLQLHESSTPTVASTPSTRDVVRNDDAPTLRPAADNPARQRRKKKQMEAKQQEQQQAQQPPSLDASTAITSAAKQDHELLLASTRQYRPPTWPSSHPREHPSWHLPELPPVSQAPPRKPAANHSRAGKGNVNQAAAYAAPVIVWLRQEMRLSDNPALCAAAATGRPVIPVFILAPDAEEGGWPLMGAAKYWVHHSLNNLQHSLAMIGSGLVLRDGRGDEASGGEGSLVQLLMLCQETGATDVFWCDAYEPWRHERDGQIAAILIDSGINVHALRGNALYAPWDARPDEKSSKMGFGSVGFFLNACADLPDPPPPLEPPKSLLSPGRWPMSLPLSALGLDALPHKHKTRALIDWASGIRQFWVAGEQGALDALEGFLRDGAARKFEGRDRHRADQRNTAVISPYLRFGELTARTVLHKIREAMGTRAPPSFLRKLAWRDLAYWSLWRFPTLPSKGFRSHYDSQPWEADEKLFQAWCGARTGYPLVDAAMTQLWAVGWMPNYMRHVAASFLVEFLNIDWRKGERWFHETLVDADVAINAYMWQNGGHSGMDQWNFVMHPVFAAKSCDPDGDYVRTWLPALSKLPVEFIHCPWEAPQALRAACKLSMGGGGYPARIVTDLEAARKRSHNAVMSVRNGIGKQFILPSGHEWIDIGNGKRAVLITRSDFREGSITTRQTPEAKWDKSRREKDDLLSMAMRDSQREQQSAAATSAMSSL